MAYTYTSALYSYTLGLLLRSVNLNNLLFIIFSVELLSYLTEFWEPVPSHLPFASGLACDWSWIGQEEMACLEAAVTSVGLHLDLKPAPSEKSQRSLSPVSTDCLAL